MKRVLLINFGGPRNSSEIERFLTDLFCDPFVFDPPIPNFFRKKLGAFIAKKRAPKVKHLYDSMGFGGGSPLVAETEKQAKSLEKVLNSSGKEEWKVDIAMTCGFPNIREIPKERLIPSKDNILFAMFPQSSRSTFLSVANIIQEMTDSNPIGKTGWIKPFYQNNNFVVTTTNLILDFFKGKLKEEFIQIQNKSIEDWENLTLVYSAHGIPVKHISKKGDVYRNHIEESKELITSGLRNAGFKGQDFLSFQSKVGPVKWTEPYTKDLLKTLGEQGHKRIAIFPISFVSDHLETLEEIGIELRDIALGNGVKEYFRIPAHGIYAEFIDCLAKIVLEESGK